jgi:phosphoribosylformimino-5-aminoimidazole carboxamide ribotide isomerase
METVRAVVDAGASRIILGTAAHRDPAFLASSVEAFPGKIVVGIDGKAGKVALRGWLDITETDSVTFAREMAWAGVVRIIYTDVLSDGMMQGLNLDATQAVAKAVDIPVTASGGVSSLDDLRAVCRLEPDGVDEVIVGRALYLGVFTLAEAVAAVRETP